MKITRSEIVYRGGICSIDDRAEFEKTVTLRVNCRFDSGLVLSSDISFTMFHFKSRKQPTRETQPFRAIGGREMR